MDKHSFMDIAGNIITTVFGSGNSEKDIPKKYHKFLLRSGMKTKQSHPYTYDPFLLYFNQDAKREADDGLYTDRLLMWDYAKHNMLCEKHFGNAAQYWDDRDPKKIEAFLRDWTGKKVVLVVNIQYVNMGNGYPLWFLGYYIEDNPEEQKNTPIGKGNTE